MKVLLGNIGYYIHDVLAMSGSGMNFYNEDLTEEGGGSILPFLGFMCSLFGILLLVVGIVRYVSAKRKFNMYFDPYKTEEPDEASYKKEKIASIVCIVLGAVLMVASFVLL
ncbi:MAG: hypothetical protein IJB96_02540 [Lachnospira sp.]|nr:hypothetical protein [Lachnospira sp.]